jgi:hypothetical protein
MHCLLSAKIRNVSLYQSTIFFYELLNESAEVSLLSEEKRMEVYIYAHIFLCIVHMYMYIYIR